MNLADGKAGIHNSPQCILFDKLIVMHGVGRAHSFVTPGVQLARRCTRPNYSGLNICAEEAGMFDTDVTITHAPATT